MSETSGVRTLLSPYCVGDGLDIGFGGDPIVPWAICFDLPKPYNLVGNSPQHLHGDAHSLPFKDRTLDWVYSSHLIEDFVYDEQVTLLNEWVRVLKPTGVLILCAPNQQKYFECCKRTGQLEIINKAHKESDYSLVTFKDRVWNKIHGCQAVYERDSIGEYSWCFVGKRL